MTVSDAERVARVRNGSRRQRDLAAARAAGVLADGERETQLLSDAVATPKADAAWSAVRALLEDRLPQLGFELWVEPISVVGEHDGALVLTAPGPVVAWIRRRYGRALGDLVRDESGYCGAYVCRREEAPDWLL